MNTLRRIKSVTTESPYQLHVTWKDGATDLIDLTGIVDGLEYFTSLRDPKLFATVQVIDHGSGVEWENGLDYSSDSLAYLAEEQRQIDGKDAQREPSRGTRFTDVHR
jgi:hypothetical protein